MTAKIVAPTVDIESTTTTIKSTKINLLGQTLIDGTLDITQNLSTGGNAKIGGSITDSRGDLTNHTNAGYGRD